MKIGMKYRKSVIYLVLIVLLALAVVGADLPGTRAQGANRVGLVVLHGDGRQVTRCIEFSEPEISGHDVLVRSGLGVVSAFDSGYGALICAIDSEGCPAENCLCQCQGSECVYWAYYHLVNGQWLYSSLGASNYKVHSGDVEGWAWGQGSMEGGAQPPVIPFDQICASPPTDTPVPPPTETPLPAPTVTSPPPTPVVWFRLDDNPIPAGACTMVRWDTSDALDVYLDAERVSLDGGREACPTASQEYHLRVVSAAGEQTYVLVLGVTGAAPSPTPTPRSVAALSPSSSPTLQPATTAAPLSSPTPRSVAALSPLPSPTSELAVVVSPSPFPTHATQPILTPSLSSGATQPTSDDQRSSSALQLGYITFNFIMIGLLSWLIFRILRRR